MRWWTSIYGAHFVAYSFRELGGFFIAEQASLRTEFVSSFSSTPSFLFIAVELAARKKQTACEIALDVASSRPSGFLSI